MFVCLHYFSQWDVVHIFDIFNAKECLSVEGPSLACSQTFSIYQTFIIWPCNDLDYGIISTQFNAQNFLYACIFLSILWFYGIQHSCEKMYKIGKCLVQQESRRPSPHLLMESQTQFDLVVTLTLVWPWPHYWPWPQTSQTKLNWCSGSKLNIFHELTLTQWSWYSDWPRYCQDGVCKLPLSVSASVSLFSWGKQCW